MLYRQTNQQEPQDKRPRIQYHPTWKQHLAWNLLHNPLIVELLFGGGAGGGKSTFGCTWIVINCERYPASRWLIGRKELKRLKMTTLATLFDLLGKWGYKSGLHYNYNAQDSKITFSNRSEILLMDLDKLPSDPNYERLGSLEITGGFVDEASEIEHKCKEVLRSRIRYKLDEFGISPKLLLTCNPSKNWLYNEFYKPSRENRLDQDKAFIQSLVTDNPHISPHYIASLRALKDRVLRERLLNGNWEYEESEGALFQYDKLLEMFVPTSHPAIGEQYISCDAARFGNDKAVINRWVGLTRVEHKEYAKSATTLIEDEIRKLAASHFIPMNHVVIDEEGVGGGIVDHLKCKGFVGGSSPIDRRKDVEKELKTEYKINYKNLRAQCYHKLAELANEGIVKIATEDAQYKEYVVQELEQIRVINFDTDGKFQIIPKDEIKLAIARSPDYADTLMMRMYFEVNPIRKGGRGLADKPLGW